MIKMNRIISSMALMSALVTQAKAQEANQVETAQQPAAMIVAVQGSETNSVAVTMTPTNMTVQVNALTNVVSDVASTNSTTQAEGPEVTPEQEAMYQEVMAQIPAEVSAITNGLSAEQLFAVCAGMHFEPEVGTHALMIQYWKAAEAGRDIRSLEQSYAKRSSQQNAFMQTCQEAAADARINGEQTFTVSGVSFDLDSPELSKDLLTFRAAKESGKMSVIVAGRPYSIIRTKEEEKAFRKRFNRETQQWELIPKANRVSRSERRRQGRSSSRSRGE